MAKKNDQGIVPASGSIVPSADPNIQSHALGAVSNARARRIPTTAELEGWIAQKISDKLGAQQPFTAWDLTTEMRGDHLDVEIEHELVRPMVVIAATNLGLDVNWVDYGGQTARTYSPPYQLQPALSGAAAAVAAGIPIIDVTPSQRGSGQPLQLLPGVDEA